MNKIFLKGNVGADPRITDFENGGKVAQFSLATTEKGFKTRDGREVPDETTWHNIVVKRTGLAGVCQQFVKKGTPLLIVGRVTNRSYEGSDGADHYITEVIVEDLELLGSGQRRDEAPAPAPDDKPSGHSYQDVYDRAYGRGASGEAANYNPLFDGPDMPNV